jgi:hypothetical protein
MEIIVKKISLEPYKSRLFGTIDSVINGKFQDVFDNTYDGEFYDGNYGLIPSDIEIGQEFLQLISAQTDVNINIRDEEKGTYYHVAQLPYSGAQLDVRYSADTIYYIAPAKVSGGSLSIYSDKGITEHKYLSYRTLVEWYHFMCKYNRDYVGKICRPPYTDVVTTGAVDYFYKVEQGFPETSLEYYQEQDNLYNSRGGNRFFNYISEHYFNISASTVEGTHCGSITIPLLITQDIDDMGQYENYADKFKTGVTYFSGDIVTYDNKTWYLNKTEGGSKYDETYRETSFNENDFTEYLKVTRNDSLSGYVVSGYSESLLISLKDFALLTDNIGNIIDGTYNVSGNPYPLENETIDIPYHIGNVSQLSVIGSGDTLFGNRINDIIFYYEDFNNEIVISGRGNSADNTTIISGLVESANVKYNNPDITFDNTLKCRISYVIGGELEIDANSDGNYTYISGGVQYIDDVELTEKIAYYYLSEDVNYPIKTYEMVYDLNGYDLEEYNEKRVIAKMSKFSTVIDEGCIDETFIASPLVKQDYSFGISTDMYKKSDVYIERGMATAQDKHLMFSEINSIDDLEHYKGGGFFQIIEN